MIVDQNYPINFNKFMNPMQYPSYQTYDICREALRRNARTFARYVCPRFYDDSEILTMCAKTDPTILYYNDKYFNEDVYCAVVADKPNSLGFIRSQTPKICLTALESNWSMYEYTMINIPIEGELLRGINKLKLLKGPMED